MNCFSEANLCFIHVGIFAAAEGESETEVAAAEVRWQLYRE